eukprot:948740-Prorocentrum_lima.AAC.1
MARKDKAHQKMSSALQALALQAAHQELKKRWCRQKRPSPTKRLCRQRKPSPTSQQRPGRR